MCSAAFAPVPFSSPVLDPPLVLRFSDRDRLNRAIFEWLGVARLVARRLLFLLERFQVGVSNG